VGRDPAEITKTAFMVFALQDDEAKAERLRGLFAPQMPEDERKRNMAVGNAEQIVEVLHRYREAGAQEAIFQSIPNNPRLYERINDEVLSAFD
jgi:alkanesulfonate monooxygenase SsuD/methylene tetrahydromethanopterin reductase-like flavin-dependent oxidoreductase (luciferase family)